jgi:hypothetical protein
LKQNRQAQVAKPKLQARKGFFAESEIKIAAAGWVELSSFQFRRANAAHFWRIKRGTGAEEPEPKNRCWD